MNKKSARVWAGRNFFKNFRPWPVHWNFLFTGQSVTPPMAVASEVGPLDCITIPLKNDHQHRRRVTFPPSRKIGRKWVRLQSPELPRGSLGAESSTFMVVRGVPSPLEPQQGLKNTIWGRPTRLYYNPIEKRPPA